MNRLDQLVRIIELIAHDVPDRTIMDSDGRAHPGIADDVGISEVNLKNTIHFIFDGAGVSTRAELARWWNEGQEWKKRNGLPIREYQKPRRLDSRYAIPGDALKEKRRWDDCPESRERSESLRPAFFPKRGSARKPPAGRIVPIFYKLIFNDAYFESLRNAYVARLAAKKNKP